MSVKDKLDEIFSVLARAKEVRTPSFCLSQLAWITFLKLLDCYETKQETETRSRGNVYQPILDRSYHWSNWTGPSNDRNAQTRNENSKDHLIDFVNDELFPHLKGVSDSLEYDNDISKKSMDYCAGGIFRHMKNRFVSNADLQEVLAIFNTINFEDESSLQEFASCYDNLLEIWGKESWHTSEIFTPRPLIRAIINVIKPQVGETIYDPAAGTCGFLTESFNYLSSNKLQYSSEQWRFIKENTFFGIEKLSLPYLLGMVNMLLHGIEPPNLTGGSITDYDHNLNQGEKFDIVLAHLPIGQKVQPEFTEKFPLKNSSIELLYLQHIMQSLKANGRAAVIVPDWILRGNDDDCKMIRQKLLEQFNLHMVLSLPVSATLPYSYVRSSVLFFDCSNKSSEVWYYESDFQFEKSDDEIATDGHFREFSELRLTRPWTERSWLVTVSELDENYDLFPENRKSKELAPQVFDYKKVAEFKQIQLELVKQNLTVKLEAWFETAANRHPLADLVAVQTGEPIPESSKLLRAKTDHPYLRVEDFEEFGAPNMETAMYLSDAALAEMTGGTVRENDLCVCVSGKIGKIGRACVIPKELDGAKLTEDAAILRVKDRDQLDVKYLYLYTLTEDFRSQVSGANKSWQHPKVELDDLRQFKVPVCPVEIQLELASNVWQIIDEVNGLAIEDDGKGYVDERSMVRFRAQVEHVNDLIKNLRIANGAKKSSGNFPTDAAGAKLELEFRCGLLLMLILQEPLPQLPNCGIRKLSFNETVDGFNTVQLVAHLENSDTRERSRMLGQVHEAVAVSENCPALGSFLQSAWTDFHAPLFDRGRDSFVLFTASLSEIDHENVQFLLDQAKRHANANEYFNELQQSDVDSEKLDNCLFVMRTHLRNANNGKEVGNEELHALLRHLHTIEYGRGWQSSVVKPLLNARVIDDLEPNSAWRDLEKFALSLDRAETVTMDRVPEGLHRAFKEKHGGPAPNGALKQRTPEVSDWADSEKGSLLSLLILAGSWDENNEHDRTALFKLVGLDRASWFASVREFVQIPHSPVQFRNGIWELSGKQELFAQVGHRVPLEKLPVFKEMALQVLSERDLTLASSPLQPLPDTAEDGLPRFSKRLREGIAEGLAILGNFADPATDSAESELGKVPRTVVHELLSSADWRLWATLNGLLANLAEAAPLEFLNQVVSSLQESGCPFEKITALDAGNGSPDRHVTGLLRALESLAWHESYLGTVCDCLCGLDRLCQNGNGVNNPFASLVSILSPWSPNTTANPESRMSVLKNVADSYEITGWLLLMKFLSEQTTESQGTCKPRWMRIREHSEPEIQTTLELRQQMDLIANLAVRQADSNAQRIVELIGHIENLSETAHLNLTAKLSDFASGGVSDADRKLVWESLQKCVLKHGKFPDAEWSLPTDRIANLEAIVERLKPKDPSILHQHLFSNREFELYNNLATLEEQEADLSRRRISAIAELLASHGVAGVLAFKDKVEAPLQVGIALAAIEHDETDREIISGCLSTKENGVAGFAAAFTRERWRIQGWKWVDKVLQSSWFNADMIDFLSHLPFEEGNWERASSSDKIDAKTYWQRIQPDIHASDSLELQVATENFIGHGRPKAAIQCLDRMRRNGQKIEVSQCVQALLGALDSDEPESPLHQFGVAELVRLTQNDPKVDPDTHCRVEWEYLHLLNGDHDLRPKHLNEKLSTDPGYFCEIIGLVYKSAHGGHQARSSNESDISKGKKLLHYWTGLPGKSLNGGFHPEKFKSWFKQVREFCKKSGHLEVALYHIGKMLSTVVCQSNGSGVNRTIAEILEHEKRDDLLAGFRNGAADIVAAVKMEPAGRTGQGRAWEHFAMGKDIRKDAFPRLADAFQKISSDLQSQSRKSVHVHDG